MLDKVKRLLDIFVEVGLLKPNLQSATSTIHNPPKSDRKEVVPF